jgi:hypothetical protein
MKEMKAILLLTLIGSLPSILVADSVSPEAKQAVQLVEKFLGLMQEGKETEAEKLLVTKAEIKDYPESETILPMLSEQFEKFKKTQKRIKKGEAFGDQIEVLEFRFHEIEFHRSYEWPSTEVYSVTYHILFRYRDADREGKTNNRSDIAVGKTQDGELKIFLFDD